MKKVKSTIQILFSLVIILVMIYLLIGEDPSLVSLELPRFESPIGTSGAMESTMEGSIWRDMVEKIVEAVQKMRNAIPVLP